MSKTDAYFISDAHLGVAVAQHDCREKDLLAFLAQIRDRAAHLFIMGDFFDFWIEYPRLIRSEYFPAVHALRLLVDSGTEVHYLAGNHDFALGPFLPAYTGVITHDDRLDITLQGRRMHLFHGDGIIKSDVGYRFLRKILRNSTYQKLYKMLHPDIGIGIALRLSRASRRLLRGIRRDRFLAEYRSAAADILAGETDIVVFGHTHRVELATAGNKVYCNTGEWIREYNYARLREGVMTIWRHVPGQPDQELPARALNLKSAVDKGD